MSLSLGVRRQFSKPDVKALWQSRCRWVTTLGTARREDSWVNAALAADEASRRWWTRMQWGGRLELLNQSRRPHDLARAWEEARRGLEGRTDRSEFGKVERLQRRWTR
jgi:hypothetical protein